MLDETTAELLLFAGGMVLNVFVVPTLWNSDSAVPRTQSDPTALALVAVAVGYGSLGLVWPMISSALGAVLWGLVAIYRSL